MKLVYKFCNVQWRTQKLAKEKGWIFLYPLLSLHPPPPTKKKNRNYTNFMESDSSVLCTSWFLGIFLQIKRGKV